MKALSTSVMIPITLVTLLAVPARAQETAMPQVATLGRVSLDTHPSVALDLHVSANDRIVSLMPELVGQFGRGPLAVGVNLGLSHVIVEGIEGAGSGTRFGNITLFGKGRHCFKGALETCVGGQLELSFAPGAVDDLDAASAAIFGILNHMRLSSRFGSKQMGLSPSAAVTTAGRWFFLQAYTGVDMFFPLGDEPGVGRSAEAALFYGGLLGATIADRVSIGAGPRGLTILTEDEVTDGTLVSMDLVLEAYLGKVRPNVKLSVPLDDQQRELKDVTVTTGVSFLF